MNTTEQPEWMTPREVARAFRVDPKTVARWDGAGRFPPGTVIRTPGNVRRFRTTVILGLLSGQGGGQS